MSLRIRLVIMKGNPLTKSRLDFSVFQRKSHSSLHCQVLTPVPKQHLCQYHLSGKMALPRPSSAQYFTTCSDYDQSPITPNGRARAPRAPQASYNAANFCRAKPNLFFADSFANSKYRALSSLTSYDICSITFTSHRFLDSSSTNGIAAPSTSIRPMASFSANSS